MVNYKKGDFCSSHNKPTKIVQEGTLWGAINTCLQMKLLEAILQEIHPNEIVSNKKNGM